MWVFPYLHVKVTPNCEMYDIRNRIILFNAELYKRTDTKQSDENNTQIYYK